MSRVSVQAWHVVVPHPLRSLSIRAPATSPVATSMAAPKIAAGSQGDPVFRPRRSKFCGGNGGCGGAATGSA